MDTLSAALAVIGVLFVLPLGTVFAEALRHGLAFAGGALAEPDALSAIRLTLFVAAIAVPLNTVCGLAAAWCLTKFDFPAKRALLVLIELPLDRLSGDLRPGVGAAVRRQWLVRPRARRT